MHVMIKRKRRKKTILKETAVTILTLIGEIAWQCAKYKFLFIESYVCILFCR